MRSSLWRALPSFMGMAHDSGSTSGQRGGHLENFSGLEPDSPGQVLALTALYVPYSLDSNQVDDAGWLTMNMLAPSAASMHSHSLSPYISIAISLSFSLSLLSVSLSFSLSRLTMSMSTPSAASRYSLSLFIYPSTSLYVSLTHTFASSLSHTQTCTLSPHVP